MKSAQDLRTADLATIEQRNAQVDAALEAAQADVDDKFAKAEASQLEDKVELLEAAAQRDKVVDEKFAAADDKFAAAEAQRLEDAAAAATAQEALKAEVAEKMSAADAKRAADQTAVNDKFTALETVRQGDLQDAEEKRRLASEAVNDAVRRVDHSYRRVIQAACRRGDRRGARGRDECGPGREAVDAGHRDGRQIDGSAGASSGGSGGAGAGDDGALRGLGE